MEQYCQQWVRGKCRRSQCKFIHDMLQLPVKAHRDAQLIDPSGFHQTDTTDTSTTPLLINAASAVEDVDGKHKDNTSGCVYIRSNGWRCKCTGIFVSDVSGELYCHNHYQLIHNQTITVLADDGDDDDDKNDTNTTDRKLDINTHTNNKRTAHSLAMAVPIRQVKRVSAKSRMVNPFEVHYTVGGMKRNRIAVVDRAAFIHPEHDLVLDIGESILTLLSSCYSY